MQFPPGGVQFQQKGMCKFSKRGVHSGLWLMNCSSSCRAGKDGGIYEMLPQFICELGVLFFYFSLLAKPATANIKPISPMPVVMYEKLPDHETSKQMANKRMAMPNPIFFIRSHPVSNWIYLFCQIGIGLLILFSNDYPNPPTV